jgi:hypothetical protein
MKKYQMAQIEHLSKGREFVRDFHTCRRGNIANSYINLAKKEEATAKEFNFVKIDRDLPRFIRTLTR